MKMRTTIAMAALISALATPAMAGNYDLAGISQVSSHASGKYVNPMGFRVHPVSNGTDFMLSYGDVTDKVIEGPVATFLPPAPTDTSGTCPPGQWGYMTNNRTTLDQNIKDGYDCIDANNLKNVEGGEIAAFVAKRLGPEHGLRVINMFRDGTALMGLDPKYSRDKGYHDGLVEKLRTPNI